MLDKVCMKHCSADFTCGKGLWALKLQAVIQSSERSVSSREKQHMLAKTGMQQCRAFMQIAVRGRRLEGGRKPWRDPLRNDPLVVHRCTWEEDRVEGQGQLSLIEDTWSK